MKNGKTLVRFGVIAILLLVIAGCSSSEQEHTHENHSNGESTIDMPLAVKEKPGNIQPYPLEKCLVSGEALGSMGEPTVLTYKGKEIKLCCSDCVEGFNKEPEKYLAALNSGTVLEEGGHDASTHKH